MAEAFHDLRDPAARARALAQPVLVEFLERRGRPRRAQPRALGSHLWLLRNEVATEENAALARLYALEALAWMTEEAVVARVDASAGLIENPRRGVWLRIDLYARDGSRVFAEKYERFWQEMR